MRPLRSVLPVLIVLAAACGGNGSADATGDGKVSDDAATEGMVVFGEDETVCPSLTLANDLDDEQRAREAATCLLDSVTAGIPAVWDVSLPTVEGDPIYHRFDATGDDVVIIVDDRADTFGAGTVRARRCATVIASDAEWLPVGVDCSPIEHPGFSDAATAADAAG